MSPKLSVIMPVCNVESYLAECLDSALSQSFHEIEIICINDGSTDRSLQILREYEKKDPRVKVIDKANAGYGAAMNDGLDAATGEYVGILESDDYACEHAWEKLYTLAKEHDLDIVKGCYLQFTDTKESYFDAIAKVALPLSRSASSCSHRNRFQAARLPTMLLDKSKYLDSNL